MKAALAMVLVLAAIGCENTNQPASGQPSATKPGKGKGQLSPAVAALEERVAALETSFKVMPSSSSDPRDRLDRLEMTLGRYTPALDMLQQFFVQRKQQEEMKRQSTHDPDAIFAVDVAPAIKANQVDGPATAGVTIVEAWDFA